MRCSLYSGSYTGRWLSRPTGTLQGRLAAEIDRAELRGDPLDAPAEIHEVELAIRVLSE
jgi:hypothetical protein